MRILNLVNKEKSEIDYEVINFSDSQKLIKINGFVSISTEIQIYSRMSWEDLQLIICAKKALDNLNITNVDLYVPYFLGARSDRAFSKNGVRYLKDIICPIINNLNFSNVIVMDAHSIVLENTLDRILTVHNQGLVHFTLKHFDLKKLSLCFPDAGAQKRYEDVIIEYDLPYFNCSKKRSFLTGEIVDTVINGSPNNSDDDIIIIDDICSGGKKFIEIAKKLKISNPNSKLYLCVTHFDGGHDIELTRSLLSKYFDRVYTTNSIREIKNEATYIKFIDELEVESYLVKQLNIF